MPTISVRNIFHNSRVRGRRIEPSRTVFSETVLPYNNLSLTASIQKSSLPLDRLQRKYYR